MPNKKKQKNRVPRQFLLLWTRALCRGALILKTGAGSTKQSKEECKKGKKKKRERKSQQLSRTVRKSMRNLCSPSSRCAASLPSLPYVFIYPVMWVPVHGQPRNFSGTSGSNGERVLSTEAERRELRLRLDVGSRQWNVAAARQQESPQRPFTLMGLNQRCAP